MTRERVLKALSRFDVATAMDVSLALGYSGSNRNVWQALQRLVEAGLAVRDGGHKRVARYHVTDAGREAVRGAA